MSKETFSYSGRVEKAQESIERLKLTWEILEESNNLYNRYKWQYQDARREEEQAIFENRHPYNKKRPMRHKFDARIVVSAIRRVDPEMADRLVESFYNKSPTSDHIEWKAKNVWVAMCTQSLLKNPDNEAKELRFVTEESEIK